MITRLLVLVSATMLIACSTSASPQYFSGGTPGYAIYVVTMESGAPKALEADYIAPSGAHGEVTILKQRLMFRRLRGNIFDLRQGGAFCGKVRVGYREDGAVMTLEELGVGAPLLKVARSSFEDIASFRTDLLAVAAKENAYIRQVHHQHATPLPYMQAGAPFHCE